MTYIDLQEGDLREGYNRVIENVKGLLHSSSLLTDNRDTLQHALGLYVYAVEEFGKALLLKEYITGKNYQVPGWIIGKGNPKIGDIKTDGILSKLLYKHLGDPELKPNDRMVAHHAKLLIGSDHLPPECGHIARGVWMSSPNPSDIVINFDSNRVVFIPKWTTGGLTDTTHIHLDPEKLTFFDLDLKTSCFYMDFDIASGTWKYDIFTDEAQLKENIRRFKETLDNLS